MNLHIFVYICLTWTVSGSAHSNNFKLMKRENQKES